MLRTTAILVLAATAAAPVPKALKARAADIDGKWKAIAIVSNGDDVLPNNPWVWDIRGEEVTIFNIQPDGSLQPNDPKTKTTLTRPTAAGPAEWDYTRDDGVRRFLFRGRVSLSADELVICFGEVDGPRPAELKPDKTTYYYRFSRMAVK